MVLIQGLLFLVSLRSRLNHKADVLAHESFVVGGNSLLSPAEFDEFLSFILTKRCQEQPKILNNRMLLIVGITTALVLSVTTQ